MVLALSWNPAVHLLLLDSILAKRTLLSFLQDVILSICLFETFIGIRGSKLLLAKLGILRKDLSRSRGLYQLCECSLNLGLKTRNYEN